MVWLATGRVGRHRPQATLACQHYSAIYWRTGGCEGVYEPKVTCKAWWVDCAPVHWHENDLLLLSPGPRRGTHMDSLGTLPAD